MCLRLAELTLWNTATRILATRGGGVEKWMRKDSPSWIVTARSLKSEMIWAARLSLELKANVAGMLLKTFRRVNGRCLSEGWDSSSYHCVWKGALRPSPVCFSLSEMIAYEHWVPRFARRISRSLEY